MDERRDFISEKDRLRHVLIKKRSALPNRVERECAATERILPLIKGSVMLYAPIGRELNTSALFTMLKNNNIDVYLPFTKDGIIYPQNADKLGQPDRLGNLPRECYSQLDLSRNHIPKFCVVPLVGINSKGFRLGYGKGCYDRFFANHTNIYKIGLCFDCQLAEFREEPHDIPLDCCVTETKVIYF